jgi:hypothetical protein
VGFKGGIGGYGFLRGIKVGPGRPFFGERVGVPVFEPGKKKTLRNRIIFGT